jgi:uncharacterized protein
MAPYPQYCPDFVLQINGEALPPALRGSIGSVKYQDGLQGADRVEVIFANPGLRWLDHPLLQADNGLRLAIGYQPGPLEEVFVGEITGVEPSFPSSSMPTVKVIAHDFLQRLTRGTKDRGFRIHMPTVGNIPLPDAVAASIVSATNLLIPMPDPVGGPLSVLMTIGAIVAAPQVAQLGVPLQSGQSDFEFLIQLGKKNGWEISIDHTLEPRGRVLRFRFMIQDYTPSLTLTYGASLIDFNPRVTTVGDIFGVAARIWVPPVQTEFVIVVSWDYDRAAFNLSVYPNLVGEIDEILGPENAKATVSINPIGFPNSLQQIFGELLPRLNNRLTGTGNAVGDPRIKTGRVINLEGLGAQFSGLYRITSATHTLDEAGYRTEYEVRKEVWYEAWEKVRSGSVPIPTGVRVQGERVM